MSKTGRNQAKNTQIVSKLHGLALYLHEERTMKLHRFIPIICIISTMLLSGCGKEFRTTVVDSGIPDPEMYDEFVVELTDDNVNDYLQIRATTNKDSRDHNTDEYHKLLLISLPYGEGWLFRECSTDIRIEVEIPIKYMHRTEVIDDPRYLFRPFEVYETGDFDGSPTIIHAQGKLKFQSRNSIKEYKADDFQYTRTVVFHDDTERVDYLNVDTYKYPY